MAVKTIGIIGGGQLGRMLTEAAKPLGFKVVVVDPNPNSPAAQVGARQIIGTFDDAVAINKLAKLSDVITVESEHINTVALDALSLEGMAIAPDVASIQLTADKWLEKQFLHDAGIPAAKAVLINSVAKAEQVLKSFGGRMVIKLRTGGYDGKGNFVINSKSAIKHAFALTDPDQLYAEAFVPFKKELAIMVVSHQNGNLTNYPVVETIQKNNICQMVLAPAPVDQLIALKAEAVALRVVQNLNGPGVFGVEMFLTKTNEIMVNEIAPRVHNSGHYTINACNTSQFEQHLRAISGLPLGDSTMIAPAAAMINILGERDGPFKPKIPAAIKKLSNVSVHLYGKAETREGRKMGHITATADTIKAAKQIAQKALSLITI